MLSITSERIGAPYKWSDAKFAWRAARKTWKNFGPVRYDAINEEHFILLEDAWREVIYHIAFAEYAAWRGAANKAAKKHHEECMKWAETLATNRRFFRAVLEAALMLEIAGKKLARNFDGAISIQAEEKKLPRKIITEQTAIQDAVIKNYAKYEAETIGLASSLMKRPQKNKDDAFSVSEEMRKTFAKQTAETILTMEQLLKEVRYRRETCEPMQMQPKEAKTPHKYFQSDIKISEAYQRNANAVLSDLYYSNKPLSFEAFKKLETPVGFAPFRDFVIGDYAYQEAIFRMILEGPLTAGRPLATDWELNVDVPDISDRGTCTIPAAGARVKFTKHFYAPPEVHVAVRGGLGATPEYDVDIKGFTIILRKADGTNTEGVISWSANGY